MSEPRIAAARPAATVIVMRDGDPFELLMVRRNDTVAFMAGSYVFPGGRVDEGDRPPAGVRLNPALFPDLSPVEEATYRMAAVRELQEEANVYLTVDAGNLWAAAEDGIFQPLESEVLDESIPAELRDAQNRWFGLAVRNRTIVYNTDLVELADDVEPEPGVARHNASHNCFDCVEVIGNDSPFGRPSPRSSVS